MFWWIPISMSTIYNQCQETNLNHSGIVAFVPEADVENVFYDIIMPFWDQHLESWEDKFGAGECVENVGNYMETTYVVQKTRKGTRPAMFPISTWNKHSALVAEIGDSPLLLTNNSLEAFNSSWTPGIPRKASVFQVIDAFIKEDAMSFVTFAEENRGVRPANHKRRQSNQIRMDELRALCRNYNSMEKIDFLRQCSARY